LCSRYGKKPVIIDPRKLDIFFKEDVFGGVVWRIFARLRAPAIGPGALFDSMADMPRNKLAPQAQAVGSGFLQQEIPSARVFCVIPPLEDGSLGTDMGSILADKIFEKHLRDESTIAVTLRANPLVISQQAEEKVDDNRLSLGNPVDSSGGVMSLHLGDGTQSGPVKGSQVQRLIDASQRVGGAAVPAQQDAKNASSKAKTTVINKIATRELQLDKGRTYVRHVLPESPMTDYLAFRLERKIEVYESFGIPYSMLSQKNSMGGQTGMNQNAMTTYSDSQKRIKQMLMPILREIYRYALSDSHAVDYLKDFFGKKMEEEPSEDSDKEVKKVIESKDFQDSVAVDVLFPGLPPADVVEKLFLMKAVTYEFYKNFVHAQWAIPLDAFCTEEPPNLLLEQLEE